MVKYIKMKGPESYMLEIREMDITCTDACMLLNELNYSLTKITGDSGELSFKASDMQHERSVFLIAYLDGVPMGCGAIREMDKHTAELKRIYTRKNQIGIAHKIVKYLETRANEKGFYELKLETRRINQHAIDFYQKCGYAVTKNYGIYSNRSDAVCFCKELQEKAKL